MRIYRSRKNTDSSSWFDVWIFVRHVVEGRFGFSGSWNSMMMIRVEIKLKARFYTITPLNSFSALLSLNWKISMVIYNQLFFILGVLILQFSFWIICISFTQFHFDFHFHLHTHILPCSFFVLLFFFFLKKICFYSICIYFPYQYN